MRNDFCSNYLEHSAKGTSWRKKGAKYLSRVWKNGRWVYEYKLTGKGYKKEKTENYLKAKVSSEQANAAKNANKNGYKGLGKKSNNEVVNDYSRKAESYGRKVAQAEYNYKTKSLAGIAESTIKKGQDTIKKLLSNFKTTETVTITSNLYPAGTKKVIKKK